LGFDKRDNDPIYSQQEDQKSMLPYTVSPNVDDGRIGEMGLSTLNVTDSGRGPSVKIEFTFTGSIPINRK
jgi:hypothetical protein